MMPPPAATLILTLLLLLLLIAMVKLTVVVASMKLMVLIATMRLAVMMLLLEVQLGGIMSTTGLPRLPIPAATAQATTRMNLGRSGPRPRVAPSGTGWTRACCRASAGSARGSSTPRFTSCWGRSSFGRPPGVRMETLRRRQTGKTS